MEYLIAAVVGALAGSAAAFFVFILWPKPAAPKPATHVVKKLGPSLYTVEQKRKPKRRSEVDEWKREQGQDI